MQKRTNARCWIFIVVVLSIVSVTLGTATGRGLMRRLFQFVTQSSVEDRIAQYGTAARQELSAEFQKAGLAYPSKRLGLVVIKKSRRMQLYASNEADGAMRLVKSYAIQGLSGRLGPKLREGDRQVPEGLYRIESLNPNSRFHLSLRLNYPNSFDKQMAKLDGRDNPGTDIMIHGGSASIGCLAMGNHVAELLFVAANDIGIANARVVIVPVDFRHPNYESGFRSSLRSQTIDQLPPWVDKLYTALARELASFPN